MVQNPDPVAAAAVTAALSYVAYNLGGYRVALEGEAMWAAKFGSRAKGDALLGLKETETRPEACMRILAAEVLRLRAHLPSA